MLNHRCHSVSPDAGCFRRRSRSKCIHYGPTSGRFYALTRASACLTLGAHMCPERRGITLGLFEDSLHAAARQRNADMVAREAQEQTAASSPLRRKAWELVYGAHPLLLEGVQEFRDAALRMQYAAHDDVFMMTRGVADYQPTASYGVRSRASRRKVKGWRYYIEGHWFSVLPDGRWFKCGFLDDWSGDLREQHLFLRNPALLTPEILFAHFEHEGGWSPQRVEMLPRLLDPAAHADALARAALGST